MSKEKIVVITGGADGLGKSLAASLKDEYMVIILNRNEDKLKKVSSDLGVDYVVADISDYSQVNIAIDSIIEKYGKIDCLVNNAGIWIAGQLDTISTEDIQRVINVNVLGTMYVTRAVMPHMKSRREGKIINVVSQGGLQAKLDRTIYYSSKWALTGFTKCLQLDLAPFNINVAGFYPGFMDTGIFKTAGATVDTSNAMNPDDVAKTLKFIVDTPNNLVFSEFGVNPL
jgi:uncharacterized protein